MFCWFVVLTTSQTRRVIKDGICERGWAQQYQPSISLSLSLLSNPTDVVAVHVLAIIAHPEQQRRYVPRDVENPPRRSFYFKLGGRMDRFRWNCSRKVTEMCVVHVFGFSNVRKQKQHSLPGAIVNRRCTSNEHWQRAGVTWSFISLNQNNCVD